MDVDDATRTMIANLPERTGRSLEEWFAVLDRLGAGTHGAAMTALKADGMTHGYANLVVKLHRARADGEPSGDELVDAQYAGRKAPLRPIYDRVLAAVRGLGADVEVAPKKTGVSLRRSRQFALVEAPSAARVRLGLNLRDHPASERLVAATGMCTHRVELHAPDDVDDEVLAWLREAYTRA